MFRNDNCLKVNLVSPNYLITQLGVYLLVSFYPVYVYLNAHNAYYADSVIVLMLLMVLPRVFSSFAEDNRSNIPFFLFLWSYGALSIVSLWFPQSQYVDYIWFMKSFQRLVLAAVIVWSVGTLQKSEIKVVKWINLVTCLWISLSIVLCDNGLIQKNIFEKLTFWSVVMADNNDKYYSFWLLFSLWGSVVFFWRKGFVKTSLVAFCYMFVTWALFTSTSESAQAALIVSTVIFILFSFKIYKYRSFYLFLFLLILVIPLLWVFFTPIRPEDPSSVLYRNWAVGVRVYLYDFCASIIRREVALGYGFGSTLNIPIPDGSLPGWSIFPGGHPHNIIFLFFIEQGLFGFLWCLGVLLIWFDYLYQKTASCTEGAAIWAMAFSGHVLYSLSFSIWHPDVVLSYCMFFVLLMITTSHLKPYRKTVFRAFMEKFVVIVTIVGVLSIILDYKFLKGN